MVGRTKERAENRLKSPACGYAGQQGTSAARIVAPFAAIETARLEAALLETEGRNRKDTGHCGPTFLEVPYLRAQRVRRGAPEFRRDIPFLRLLLVSKARQVVVVVILSHDAPPRLRTNP
jgi:hypothetical protein